jgi:4-hydroxybutyryl-CoA dehydratase/vinylacetyl-CoA-Delta-isomerase
MATMPSEQDLDSEAVGKYVRKYMAGVEGVSAEARMRVLRLIENMTAGTALVESMHGAGSPQTQKVMYQRLGKLDMKKRMAGKLAGLDRAQS